MEEIPKEIPEEIPIYKNNIFDYVNLAEIRKLLINYPQLCILFEMLCMHINTLIEVEVDKNSDRLIQSVS